MEQESISMEVVNPHAAGIDIGSRSHWVAVGQLEQDVREFGVFNEDLFSMADWLKTRNVKTIAMETLGLTGRTFIQYSSLKGFM
jgi:transposase